jgi:glycosyltransferase involved in cell wall biosynthesis
MNIWIVCVGEPLPVGNYTPRLLRAGLLAELLTQRGHQITWWASNFYHEKKTYYAEKESIVEKAPNYKIRLLPSIGYKKNISVQRILEHSDIAKKFYQSAIQEEKPDIIFCGYPTIDLSVMSVEYGKKFNIPVILDARDAWPDSFIRVFPPFISPLVKFALSPLFSKAKKAFSEATSIVGITDSFVNWAMQYAGRKRNILDKGFPMGYKSLKLTDLQQQEALLFWNKFNINPTDGFFYICYFGSMTDQFDMETVINAAKKLAITHTKIKFILCGRSDMTKKYAAMSGNLKNVIFPGWVDKNEIWSLMHMAHAGIAPYISSEDFRKSIPNKLIEYLAGGLPIINCLQGVTENEIIHAGNAGVQYQEFDADSLVNKVLYLYDNPSVRATFSANAFHLFQEKYTSEKTYGELADHIETVFYSYNKQSILTSSI